jgi:hypothetical protein
VLELSAMLSSLLAAEGLLRSDADDGIGLRSNVVG